LIFCAGPGEADNGMKSLLAVMLAQISIPGWLVPYPEATPQTKTFAAYTESSYTTPATPAAVTEHYRKLFTDAGMQFVANSDGVGTNVRASAPECDLLLSIRPQGTGASVRLSCAAKSPAYGTEVASTTTMPSRNVAGAPRRIASPQPAANFEEMKARHDQLVAEMGIHKQRADAPAPSLVWPSWLVHVSGSKLALERGVDQSHKDYLAAKYKSTAPMSQIYKFYEDLLNANDYRVYSSKLGTGQTMSGVSQNADGYVEGANYPDGHPGPWTVIRVDFSRFYLNEPISVRVRFTTYPYEAPRFK
jgi:hypothetical protein